MDMKKNLIIDLVALVVYLVVANPAFTGIAVHEWLSLGVFVVFLVHVAVHFDWIVETVGTVFRNPTWAHTGNFILSILILVAFMVCMVSGLFISGSVFAAFGFYVDGYYFWDPLHAMSAKMLLALLLIHIVVHWKWFMLFIAKGKGVENGSDKGK